MILDLAVAPPQSGYSSTKNRLNLNLVMLSFGFWGQGKTVVQGVKPFIAEYQQQTQPTYNPESRNQPQVT